MKEVVIGSCRLFQGDCREVLPLIESVGSVLTDPPYGMSFMSNKRKERYDKILNDDTNELANYIIEWAKIHAQHSSYVFGRWDNLWDYPKPTSLITWVKHVGSMGNLEHEHSRCTEVACFYPGPKHVWVQGRPMDVVYADRTRNTYHPTEKPKELMAKFLQWTSGTVIDPCMGSGTTGVACCDIGRPFIGIELSEEYFEIACSRIRDVQNQPMLFAELRPKTAIQQDFEGVFEERKPLPKLSVTLPLIDKLAEKPKPLKVQASPEMKDYAVIMEESAVPKAGGWRKDALPVPKPDELF